MYIFSYKQYQSKPVVCGTCGQPLRTMIELLSGTCTNCILNHKS